MLITDNLTSDVVNSVRADSPTKTLWREFGQWIKQCRENAKLSNPSLTQERVAQKAGISVVQLSRIENGESGTKRDTIIALARVIGISEAEAMDRAGFGEPKRTGSKKDTEHEREKSLLLWMFDDLPRECQLDVLASVTGIHQRRSMSARIVEKHEARIAARAEIEEHSTKHAEGRAGASHPKVAQPTALDQKTPAADRSAENGKQTGNGATLHIKNNTELEQKRTSGARRKRASR